MSLPRLGWIAALLSVALSATAAGAADGCKLQMTPPIPVRMDGAQAVISAKINGTDSQFIVDTGSFYGLISPAAVAEFKLPVSNAPFGLYMVGVGGSEAPQIATARDFSVAGFDVHNSTFLITNSDLGGVGVLGQNLFRIADVDFDLADGVLRFVRPQHCGHEVLAYWTDTRPVSAADLHRTSEQQPNLITSVSMNGHSFDALLDTGSSRTILSLRAAKRAGITPDSPGVVAAGFTGGIGRNAVKVWVAPIDEFEIGGETIRHTHVLIGDMKLEQADMLLGADFFLAHHIYAAYSQNRLYFTYNGGRVFDLNEANAHRHRARRVNRLPHHNRTALR